MFHYEIFKNAAYSCGSILWPENEESSLQSPIDDNWYKSDHLPESGTSRIVWCNSSFTHKLGDTFLIWFQPELSMLNEFHEYPDEIEMSGFLLCELVEVIRNTTTGSLCQIKVHKQVPILDIEKSLSETLSDGRFVKEFLRFDECEYIHSSKNWSFYSNKSESYAGQWILIHKLNNTKRVLAFGDWQGETDYAYMANIRLSEVEYRELVKRSNMIKD